MTITSEKITEITTAVLAQFDDETHIGFGSGTTTPAATDTDLETPVIRKAFDETPTKNIGAGTYDFSATLGLTEGNSVNMSETGLFNAASAGTMSLRKLLSSIVEKTSSKELSVGFRINAVITNT